MSAPDQDRHRDGEAPDVEAPDDEGLDSGPMNDERCLFTLSRLGDGRPVEPALAAQAQAWAATHPECTAALRELAEHAALLAATPPLRARAGFATRVLSQALPAVQALPIVQAGTQPARAGLLPFVRRLAIAAGLALAVTLCIDLARPGTLTADGDLQRLRHAADHFKPEAFGPQDIEAGLRARIRDRDFGKR